MALELLCGPIKVGSVTLPNRICYLATHTALNQNNMPSEQEANYLAQRARGGVGLIVTGIMAVHRTSLISPSIVAGYQPQSREGLHRIADVVHRYDTPILAQLWHCGRQLLWPTSGASWAPSAIGDPYSGAIPHEMTVDDIDEVIEGFAVSARNVQEAGFDGVEVHGAHGYLIGQFLSPWSNRREDDYGGTRENRMRFLNRVLTAVRETCGDRFVVAVKLNAHEFVPGGIDLDEARRITQALVTRGGIDLFTVSQGNIGKSLYTHAPDMHAPVGQYLHLVRGIKEVAGGIPVCAPATRAQLPEEAEGILQSGHADLVGLCRALVADADWPRKAKEGRSESIRRCVYCQVCWYAATQNRPITCVYGPNVAREDEVPVSPPASHAKLVAVVGGGPAGMAAAGEAARRGHRVILFEQGEHLGGQVSLMAKLPGQELWRDLVDRLSAELRELPVEIRMRTAATPELLDELGADVIVLATGAVVGSPEIITERSAQVLTGWDVLRGVAPVGDNVVVVDRDGGSAACGLAEMMAAAGKTVTLATTFDLVGRNLDLLTQLAVYRRLLEKGVRFVCGVQVVAFDGHSLRMSSVYTGEERVLQPVDSLIVAGTRSAESALGAALRGKVAELHLIGDCYAPRTVATATHEGYRIGSLI